MAFVVTCHSFSDHADAAAFIISEIGELISPGDELIICLPRQFGGTSGDFLRERIYSFLPDVKTSLLFGMGIDTFMIARKAVDAWEDASK
jgi:hypothetical protein